MSIQEDAQKFAQELAGNVVSGQYGGDPQTAKEIAFEYMGTFYGKEFPEGLKILDSMLPNEQTNGFIQ